MPLTLISRSTDFVKILRCREGATGDMHASQGTFFKFLIRRIIKLNKTSMASSGQEKNMCVSGYIFKKIRVGRKLLTFFFFKFYFPNF